jgi:nucleoside 2-deoxyribosyltransferase
MIINVQKKWNRLKHHRCYIAGPIDRAPDSGYGWRKTITPLLRSMGIVVFDPLLKPTDIGLEADDNRSSRKFLKEEEKFDEFSEIMRNIRHTDLRMVDISDFMIAYIDLDIFACGTIEEIVVCNKQKKPVLMLCKQGKVHCPDWIFGMLPHEFIFGSIEEIIDYLKDIDKGSEPDTLGRWIFFNY